MFFVSSCSCLCSIHWSQVLSWEWRCSWSSTDRQCSNYIWVINNFIAYKGTTYIRGFTVGNTAFTCVTEVCQLADVFEEGLVVDHIHQGIMFLGICIQPFCVPLQSVLQGAMGTVLVCGIVRVVVDVAHMVCDGKPFLNHQVRVSITSRSTPPEVIHHGPDPGLQSTQPCFF